MKEKKLSNGLILGIARKENLNEEINITLNARADAAKLWLEDHGFIPDVTRATIKTDLAKFEKDIEGLTIDPAYPGALFWSIAYNGIVAYVLSTKKKASQERNPRDRQKYIADKLVKIYKEIRGLMQIGVIERVDLRTILPLKSGLFSENTNPGKPINALATVIALDLVELHIPKKVASSLVYEFTKLYFPDEQTDTENIRRSLYRKRYPSSVLNPPAQKGMVKK